MTQFGEDNKSLQKLDLCTNSSSAVNKTMPCGQTTILVLFYYRHYYRIRLSFPAQTACDGLSRTNWMALTGCDVIKSSTARGSQDS